MTVSTNSIGLQGLDGFLVQVEVRSLAGMESVHVIGLPDASVKESRDRVIAALDSQGCSLPEKKVIIHLAPAEQKKNGPSFDLAIAIALMQMTGDMPHPIPDNTAFLGALSLNGEVRPVSGILPAILAAKKQKIETLYLPTDTSLPLDLIDGIKLCFVSHLSDVLSSLSPSSSLPLLAKNPQPKAAIPVPPDVDFNQIYGQESATRALEIAAAGGHHILLTGPPGCGKSLLGEAFPTLFPELSIQAQLEVMSLYELGDTEPPRLPYPPFRHPHHSSSAVSLIGGGAAPKPGEVSLANHGILFLDEMAEFPKKTLDMLRQPLEAEKVTISRVQATVTFPAQFLLIGAVNPCPCGSLGSRHHYCTCTPKQIQSYQSRLSGPIRDRFDLTVQLEPVNLQTAEQPESSSVIRKRVRQARARQHERYGISLLNGNAALETLLCTLESPLHQQQMLQDISQQNHWSNRAQVKILRIARTIADLQSSPLIHTDHLNEAITYHTKKDDRRIPRISEPPTT